MGQPPKSAALKAIQGGLAHKAKMARGDFSDAEPIQAVTAPKYLKGEARKEYLRIAKLLAQYRQWSPLFESQLAVYAKAFARWRKANDKLDTWKNRETGKPDDGEVHIAKSGYGQLNGWLVVAEKAEARMHKIATEMGLTLLAKVRVQGETVEGGKKEKAKDGWGGV